MQESRISLPPLVEGPVRGALRLSLGAPRWAEAAPAHLRQHGIDVVARVAWWGDASGGDLLPLPLPPAATAADACLSTTVSFQLRTGPKYLTRYLKDMGALTIAIEAASGSNGTSGSASAGGEAAAPQPLATATVGLLALDVASPISTAYPLVLATDTEGAAAGSGSSAGGSTAVAAAAAAIVGSLEVRLELDYSSSSGAAALVSSFELNEHLAGSTADAAEEAGATDSDSGGSSSGDADALQPSGLCEQLLAALQDREAAAAAVQPLASCEAAADEQPALEELHLQPCDAAQCFLPLLLPSASQPQLAYVAAMLQPFAGCGSSSSSSSSNCSCSSDEEHAPAAAHSVEQLAAAAAECAAVERELASQPAAEALQGLRQAAAALASRSLDLAAAFAAADGQQLPLGQLGVLLQRLYPGATADEARRLLAVVAAGGRGADVITLPALKAALARVQEAQQFPNVEDLARQQAAAEARRAKEAAAAAVAAVEQQRAAAAAAAKMPPLQRKQAVVSKLKSSLQERRRSSSSSSVQIESQAAAIAPAEQHLKPSQQQAPQLPTVVLGIPVLPPPPPAAELLAGLPAQPAALQPAVVASLPAPAATVGETGEALGEALGASATASASQQLEAPEVHEVPRPQPQQQDEPHGKPLPQQDALLQLIQQAEALKAAMQQAGSSGSDGASAISPPRSQLWEAAAASAAGPRLPNLLLPPTTSGGSADIAAAAAAADSGSLSAATAALLAAARALRLESEQLPPPLPPATAVPAPAGLPSASALAACPAATTTAGSAAMLGRAAAAAGDSDAESDAEDALLDQLFFQRTQRPVESAVAVSPAHTADGSIEQPAATQQAVALQLVLRLQLAPPQLANNGSGSSSSGGSVRCVIKPLQAGGTPQQLNVPAASAAGAAPVTVELPVAGVSSTDACLPLLPPYLFLEFWRHSGDLLGVVRVPLLQPPACGAAEQEFAAAVVAEGRQPISDILEGQGAGTIHVAAVLQERGAAPQVAAVRHCFSVAIRSAHRLPSAAAYAGAGLRAPDARLLRYSFPGEPDALQTGEVPCCSSPCFDATATHELTLPAGHSIVPLLQDGLLRFELYDCWADQQQRQQHGWALLQLRKLASLAAEADGSSSGSAARQASRTLLLPLCTEYESAGEAAGAAAGGDAAARGPSLKIELNYQAQLCTMDAAEMAAVPATAATEAEPTTSSPAQHVRAVREKSAAGGGSASSDSEAENSLLLANRSRSTSSGRPAQHAAQGRAGGSAPGAAAAAQPVARSIPSEPFVPATLSVEIIRASGLGAAVREAAAAAGGGTGTSLGRAAVVGPHAFVRLALFSEADAALQAEAPPLQTSFVPQSFCPAWRSVHSYPLQLTGAMVAALATQSMRVEVWHRCSRAAAAGGSAGSREAREVLLGAGSVALVDVLRKPQGLRCWVPLAPGSGRGGVVGAVQVAACLTSLGSLISSPNASEPLLLRCSEAAALVPLALRPRLLVPPGAGFHGQQAVLAVHLDTLVPPSSSSLSGARPKADRFFCRYSLPGGEGSSTPTASRVLSAVGGAAPAAAARKSGGRGRAAGGSAAAEQQQQWVAKMKHSGFFEVTADASLAAALLQGTLLVHVYKQPASAATEGGRSAVLVGTAEMDLSPLLWSDSSSSNCGDAEEGAASQLHCVRGTYPLLEGASAAQGGASLAAAVELQLQPEAGAAQQAAAAAAAGAHTAALEYQRPAQEEEQQQVAAAAAGSIAPPTVQPPPQQGQPQRSFHQQEQPLAAEASLSDEDDDEAHEELLQRCQRLTAALCNVCPPEAAGTEMAGGCGGEPTSGSGSAAAGEQPGAGSGDGQQQAEQKQAEGSHAASSAGSTAMPRQQQQQGGAAEQAGGGSPSAAVVQQGEPADPDEPEEACKLMLQIDSALHLPTEAPAGASSGSSGGSDGYSAFVAAAWGPHQQRTAAVPVHVVAAAELGGTAVWHAELELPAAAATWQSQACLSSSGSTGSGGPNLVLNVWLTPGSGDISGGGGAGQQASAADSLLGCCVLDLRTLPALQQVAGYWHIVDSQQRQRGQLKASVCANGALRDALQQQRSRLGHGSSSSSPKEGGPVAPAAALGAAAAEAPSQQQQQAWQVPAAAAVSEQAAMDQPEVAGDDLAQQVQAQLQELELLSQRLAAQPPSAAHAAAEAPAGTRCWAAEQPDGSPGAAAQAAEAQHPPLAVSAAAAAGAGGDDASVAALLAAAGPLQADAAVVKPYDTLPASDDEWDGSALPLDSRQTGLFAWSGSDSDDGMGLVGIAVDGAISGEVTEEEQEEERPRPPARLLAEDWMFAISKTAAEPEEEQLAIERAMGQSEQPEQQQQQQAVGQPAQQRPPVRFRNVIPGGALGGAAGKEPTAPASHLEELAEQRQREEEQGQTAQALLQQSAAAQAVAAVESARSAAAVEAARAAAAQGPTLHQFGAATPTAAAAQQAPVQLQQPLPRRQQLPGGLQPGWQFDIRRDAPAPSAGAAASWEQSAQWQQGSSASTAATPSSVRLNQFGAQQASAAGGASQFSAATPASLLAQQRSELQQRSQAVRRSPAAAATIDEVLAQLRGRARGAAGAGASGAAGGNER